MMEHTEKCKMMVCAEVSLNRAKNKLEAHGENYADVIHDLAEVVNMLFEIKKDELENDA